MSTENQKAQFLQAVRDTMGELGRLNDRANGMRQTYNDRGYDVAGEDAVTDVQLAQFGVTRPDLDAAMDILQQIKAFFNGQATVTSAAYRATVNKWRQV